MIPEMVEKHQSQIIEVCRKYRVRELSLFGSVARGDYRDQSDVDLLVEFEPEAEIGLITFNKLQRELADIVGRPVDLVSKQGLKPVIRQNVLAEAELLYAA